MSKIVSILFEKLTVIIEEMGYELVDIKYQKESGNWYLRFFIDKENGITLDDCQLVSRKVDKILDEIDIIPDAYLLEISSPGVERPLKKITDFQRFCGSKAKIITKEAIENRRTFVGEILQTSHDNVTIAFEKTEITINYKNIKSANLCL